MEQIKIKGHRILQYTELPEKLYNKLKEEFDGRELDDAIIAASTVYNKLVKLGKLKSNNYYYTYYIFN